MREPMTDEVRETLEMLRRVLEPQGYRIVGTCATCRYWDADGAGWSVCHRGIEGSGHAPPADFGCTLWQAREDGG